MGKWLRHHGCEVTIASNGKLGLKYMKSKQFDVCFIDFLMPVMMGVETIVEFRRWVDKEQHMQILVGEPRILWLFYCPFLRLFLRLFLVPKKTFFGA